MKKNLLMFLPVLSLFFASCDSDSETTLTANVKVIHASPNAPNVDVLVNGNTKVQNAAYTAETPYFTTVSGNNNVVVRVASTSTNILDANFALEGNSNYSVFVVDSAAKAKYAAVKDNLATPASGKAHIRFFHYSPNAPAVDIALAGGTVLFSNRNFNDQSTNAAVSGFTEVNAGTVNLEVRLAGTSTVVLPLPGVNLQAGKIYTVYARGFVGGIGLQALGAGTIVHN
jgi:hypothetical protein